MNAATIHPSSEAQQEKKNKRRGIIIAFFLHTALLVIGLFPFLSNIQPPEPPQMNNVIVMDFTDFTPASKEGAKPKAAKKAEKKKAKAKKAVPKAKPMPKPKPAPKTPKKKTMTEPSPEPPVAPAPKEKEAPKETVIDKPQPVEDTPAPVDMEADAEEAEEDEAETASADTKTSDAKESGTGTGNTGTGKLDRGKNWGETAGEGIFSRRVTYRADVKKITKKEGKIVVELCINNGGRVVYAKADKAASTIKDNDVIRKAVHLTTKYKFEPDSTAPKKQCGKMTYIFDIEKE